MQFLEYSYGKIADKLTKLLDSLLISQTVEQLQSLLDYSIRFLLLSPLFLFYLINLFCFLYSFLLS